MKKKAAPRTKAEIIGSFDPSNMATAGSQMYGLPFSADDSNVIVVPVPWDVTVSYRDGTSLAPEAIFEASYQVDLFDAFLPDAWKHGIAMDDTPKALVQKNRTLRREAQRYIDYLFNGGSIDGKTPKDREMKKRIARLNAACEEMNRWVEARCRHWLEQEKLVAVLGGDHSTPLGLIRALTRHEGEIGILHIDAHADLRNAYEGFTYSHASIMYNAIGIPEVKKLVQVGIRDFGESEVKLIESSSGRITTWFDRDLHRLAFEGKRWHEVSDEIIGGLPDKVYVSFDIDGLDSRYCPHTGTPVPGGLDYNQALFLLERVALSGRKIVGFDLNEVGPVPVKKGAQPDEWDANVGARLLYRMTNIALRSRAEPLRHP